MFSDFCCKRKKNEKLGISKQSTIIPFNYSIEHILKDIENKWNKLREASLNEKQEKEKEIENYKKQYKEITEKAYKDADDAVKNGTDFNLGKLIIEENQKLINKCDANKPSFNLYCAIISYRDALKKASLPITGYAS